jgi:hypothetical protein
VLTARYSKDTELGALAHAVAAGAMHVDAAQAQRCFDATAECTYPLARMPSLSAGCASGVCDTATRTGCKAALCSVH